MKDSEILLWYLGVSTASLGSFYAEHSQTQVFRFVFALKSFGDHDFFVV